MPKGVKKCKVCGCEYAYCKSMRTPGTFQYQDVACCPEHGAIYLARVLEARGLKPVDQNEAAEAERVEEPVEAKVSKRKSRKKTVELDEAPAEEEMA